MPAATKKTLPAKIAAIQAEAVDVEKTGSMNFGQTKYDYMQEHALLKVLGPLWAKHNVAVVGSLVPNSVEPDGENGIRLEWELVILDGDSDSTLTFRCAGEGQDRGDKATAKAMTAANKYALQKVFQIATEAIADNDDTSSEELAQNRRRQAQSGEPTTTAAPKKASQRKLTALRQTAKDAVEGGHIPQDRIQATLQGIHGVDKINELNDAQADEFAAWLEEALGGTPA